MSQWSKSRERLLNEANGTVHSIDMLSRAHGGQWPPNGLDIVNPPQFEVHIRSMLADPRTHWDNAVETIQEKWGWATFGSLIMRSPKIAMFIMGASFLWKYASTIGYVRSSEPNVLRMNDFWMAAVLLNEASETVANTKSHEMMHLIQHYDKDVSLSSAMSNTRLGLKRLLPEGAGDDLKYLMLEYEVQARLHTVISNSYIQHGSMPGSKYELWAHLVSQGMTPPAQIMEMIKSTPELADAFKRFPRADAYVRDYSDRLFVGQLDTMSKKLGSDDHRFKVWNSIYPILYGDMIELYGDQLGMVRVGHSHNIQLREIFMRAGYEHAIDKHDNEMTQTRMEKVAAMMRPEDALSLLMLIISNKPYQELHTKPVLIQPGNGQLLAVHALFTNSAIDRNKATAAIIRATGLPVQEWAQSMVRHEERKQAKSRKTRVNVPPADTRQFSSFTPSS